VDSNSAAAPARERRGKRIEWTGAGGDYFLAIIVNDRDEVVAERWGTRQEVLAWMETHWPQLPTKFVPMVYTPARRHLKSSNERPVRSRKARDLTRRPDPPVIGDSL
jgi:hypothetical protein